MLWTFTETAIGIVREHILILKEGNIVKSILTNPRFGAITSLILSLPLGLTFVAFMFDVDPLTKLLKLLNHLFTMDGQQINNLGRIVIFGGLFLLPVAFVLNLLPILRRQGPDRKRTIYKVNLIFGIIILLFVMMIWAA